MSAQSGTTGTSSPAGRKNLFVIAATLALVVVAGGAVLDDELSVRNHAGVRAAG